MRNLWTWHFRNWRYRTPLAKNDFSALAYIRMYICMYVHTHTHTYTIYCRKSHLSRWRPLFRHKGMFQFQHTRSIRRSPENIVSVLHCSNVDDVSKRTRLRIMFSKVTHFIWNVCFMSVFFASYFALSHWHIGMNWLIAY